MKREVENRDFLTIAREMEAGATEGPWEASEGYCPERKVTDNTVYARPNAHTYIEVVESPCPSERQKTVSAENARFIAFARNVWGPMLRTVDAIKHVHPMCPEDSACALCEWRDALDAAARKAVGE